MHVWAGGHYGTTYQVRRCGELVYFTSPSCRSHVCSCAQRRRCHPFTCKNGTWQSLVACSLTEPVDTGVGWARKRRGPRAHFDVRAVCALAFVCLFSLFCATELRRTAE